MEVLGYIGYGVLVFFAVAWTFCVRTQLAAGLHTIMGALFFVVSAILIGVLEINKLHSWWVLPSGFVIVMICTVILSTEIPLLSSFVRYLGSIYASLVRIGIPAGKVSAAQTAADIETYERWVQKEDQRSEDSEIVECLKCETKNRILSQKLEEASREGRKPVCKNCGEPLTI
ncbi:MAG: hypothetical protein CMI30_10375 [Opitutae bacterium]|nr:hypothetical protein [Opitutae bacterium]|tara:strand:- start:83 stop:601 length:519 start_codon:yes stop_codon:yes gene_type:complete